MESNSDIERHNLEERLLTNFRRDLLDRQAMLVSHLFKILLLFSLMVFVYIAAKPIGGIMTQYERILAAEASGMERLPELRKQIITLEKQMAALSTTSIESRLNTIEKAIKTGDVSIDEIATLQQLLSDFQVLKSYMFDSPEDLVKLKTLQRDYSDLHKNQNSYMRSSEIEREISFLRNLFFMVIAMLGILISISGGSWWFASRKERKLSEKIDQEKN